MENVRDIVELCLSPPERALVLCVDESEGREAPNQVQALGRTQPLLPMLNATVAERDRRSAFSLDVKAGKVVGTCMRRHRAKSFAGSSTRSRRTCPWISTFTS